jgi:SAM-dependent methyltransferase
MTEKRVGGLAVVVFADNHRGENRRLDYILVRPNRWVEPRFRLKASRDTDAYGHEVWDYYTKHQGQETIEREDGFIDPSESLPQGYFAQLKGWDLVERKGIAFVKGRVLDVGCGPGRVALYLQRYRKLKVLGLDNSPLALKVAKARGVKETRLLAFEDVDFDLGSFDTVVMYGNNFGLFGSRAKAKRLLRKLYRMTTSAAIIVCSNVNPYKTDNPDHLRYQQINRARGRMAGQVKIRVRYRTWVGKWFDYLLVSPEEMKEIAVGAGWRVDRLIETGKGPLYVGVLRKSAQED